MSCAEFTKKYIKKYPMKLSNFAEFVTERIDADEETLDKIFRKFKEIHKEFQGGENISAEELEIFFHAISAGQKGLDLTKLSIEDLKSYQKIKLSKKDHNKEDQKKSKQIIEQKKVEFHKVASTSEKQKSEPKSPVISEGMPQKKTSNKDKKIQIPLDSIRETNYESGQSNSILIENEEPPKKIKNIEIMQIKSKKIKIRGYDKFGQDYLNPVIKFKIHYCSQKAVYRRYSQFQKLMAYLSKKYEGYILPELPPKEGMKRNLSLFWGIDEAFLNERQVKLQEMLNSLVECKFIFRDKYDEVLLNFLTNENYEIVLNEDNTSSYLKSLTDIAFNAKQLKDYGLAYYSYMKEYSKLEEKTSIVNKYKELEDLLTTFLELNLYRVKINQNFEKRRETLKLMTIETRSLAITDFDKIMGSSVNDIKNLNNEYNKYLDLKSQESWYSYLIKQKESVKDESLEDIKKHQVSMKERIEKMEKNLLESLIEFQQVKEELLSQISAKFNQWREKIHP